MLCDEEILVKNLEEIRQIYNEQQKKSNRKPRGGTTLDPLITTSIIPDECCSFFEPILSKLWIQHSQFFV